MRRLFLGNDSTFYPVLKKRSICTARANSSRGYIEKIQYQKQNSLINPLTFGDHFFKSSAGWNCAVQKSSTRSKKSGFPILALIGGGLIVSKHESSSGMNKITNMESIQSENPQKQKSEENVEDDDYECSFCRYFLESPCRDEFRIWRRCVLVRVCPCLNCTEDFFSDTLLLYKKMIRYSSKF